MKNLVFSLIMFVASQSFAADSIRIRAEHNTDRERRTKAQLEKVLRDYDLSKYTFTRDITIEERAMNHAFPELTLNVRFAESEDELLSSYIHEQLHWYLREHDVDQHRAVRQLREMYPDAPVGLPEGAENAYSTYGHLVDCYLEIEADRRLIGPERTVAVIKDKGHYTWIYSTILRDEPRIAAASMRTTFELSSATNNCFGTAICLSFDRIKTATCEGRRQ